MFFYPRFGVFRQGVHHMAFQLRGTAYHVFTGDDVQRGFITLFFAFHQPFGDSRSNTFQHNRANGGSD
ncbi:Uncharacterised protein [Shigella sonnei]|nr:Uncharacterised protein [Shigella sonnei]